MVDFHSLRVTFNTLLARAGASLAQRQALMRHSDPKLTAGVYTRLEVSDLVAAVATIDAPTVPGLCPPGHISAHLGASKPSDAPKTGTA